MKTSLYTKKEIVEKLRNALNTCVCVDISFGSETYLNISRTKLNSAVAELTDQGYKKYYFKIGQLEMRDENKTVIVLAKPDSTYNEVLKSKDLIIPVTK